MLDLSLLRIMKHREDFYRLKGRIPDSSLDVQTKAILDDFGKYFERLPDEKRIDFNTFLPMFRSWHSSLKDDKRTAYEQIFEQVKTDVKEDVRREVMRTLLELRLATQLAGLAEQFNEGEMPNLFHMVNKHLGDFKIDVGIKDTKWIDTDIGELLVEDNDDVGIQWRLDCLNKSMRPLRGGDFGIVAGRPDKGKTTFIASELTYIAAQLPEDKNALWLNNEGPGKRIIPRLYQSALGVTKSKLIEINKKGLLNTAYKQIMGRRDKIRTFDIHNMDNFAVEQLIENNNAGIVVYDMIDHIRGFGDSARTDLALEEMYMWGRNMSVKYDLVGIATSQISNDGDGLQYPTLGMLKDSKTGKQGACDFQIMIGAMNDPGYSAVRFISMPKNKLRRESGPSDPRATVKYEPMRARYDDLPVGAEPEKDED